MADTSYASAKLDVLLEGTPSCDLTYVFRQHAALPALGQEVFSDDFALNPGGIFNVASALARLSVRVGLKAVLGNDIFSRFIAERMEATGLTLDLTTWVDHPVPVVSSGVSFPHDRLFVSWRPPREGRDARGSITVEDLDRFSPSVLYTHGGLAPTVFAAAPRRGILIYVDTHWDPEHLRNPALRDLAAAADVFAPNLPEALEMTGTSDVDAALDVLSGWSRCVVVKCGAAGCVAACEGKRYQVPAPSVQAIDTTGAGDNFNAGLIYGLLRGHAFGDCLRCAVLVGSLSTTVLGGSSTPVTPGEVECRLNAGSRDNASGEEP